MRFKLILELLDRGKNILPINYQYELSSWIYKVLNTADSGFASWLHDRGYTDDHKQFKMFTFSNLIIPQREVHGDRLEIGCPSISMIVSMLPNDMVSYFVTGIFQDQLFILGDHLTNVPLKVISVEGLPEPVFSGRMNFIALSPLLISFKYPGDRYARYLKPDHPDYTMLFFRNLKEKYRILNGNDLPFDEKEGSFEWLIEPRKKGILIKTGTPQETKVIGYQFDFRLTAPSRLIKLGYYTGFGEKNSMGFGCAEVKKTI